MGLRAFLPVLFSTILAPLANTGTFLVSELWLVLLLLLPSVVFVVGGLSRVLQSGLAGRDRQGGERGWMD